LFVAEPPNKKPPQGSNLGEAFCIGHLMVPGEDSNLVVIFMIYNYYISP
jgi:hypothetical protein